MQPSLPSLKQRVVLVTGGTGGLGQAVVRTCLAAGARVVLTTYGDHGSWEALHRDLIEEDEGVRDRVIAVETNVGDETSVRELMRAVVARFGGLHGVVHTVGGFAMQPSLVETTAEQFDAMLAVNLRSAWLVSRAALELMRPRSTGRLIVVGALPALANRSGKSGIGAYAVSKAALLSLVETLSEEERRHGITVNALLPGTIDTSANRHAMPTADRSTWVSTESLAGVCAFLLSDLGRDVTGTMVQLPGRTASYSS